MINANDPLYPAIGDTLYPSTTGQPWVPSSYPPPSPWIPPTPLQPYGPILPPTLPMLPPSGPYIAIKSDHDRITEYRFLVKGIRELVNAGKMDPATALMAIDAMLMALDPDYDKHDAQATK